MKKVFAVLAIILVIGLLLSLVGFAILDFDLKIVKEAFANQRDSDFTAVSKTVELLPQKLEIDCVNNAIDFFEIEEDKITLDYYQSDYYCFELSENSEIVKLTAIKVNQVWPKNWRFEIGTISPEIQKVKVGLSKNFKGELIVKTINGNINLHNANELDLLKVTTSNGNISISNVFVTKDISIENTNGNIEVSNLLAREIKGKNTNGNIKLNQAQSQEIALLTANGNITVKTTNCPNIDTQTTNGNINIKSIYSFEDTKINVSNTVGNIKIGGIKYASQTLNPNAEKYIKAHNTTGAITIDFEG